MTIALDFQNSTPASFRVLPRAVDPAAQWEPGRRGAAGSEGHLRAGNIRTLTVDNRTSQTGGNISDGFRAVGITADEKVAAASARSQVLLGAVFGCAVFLGTLFAGFTGSDEAEAPTGSAAVEMSAPLVQ